MAVRAKKSTIEILATLNRIDCNSTEIFFKLFDAQVCPPLYCMERSYGGWISSTKLKGSICMPVNGFWHVLDKTPNDIVYGELGRYPLWITSISKKHKILVPLA